MRPHKRKKRPRAPPPPSFAREMSVPCPTAQSSQFSAQITQGVRSVSINDEPCSEVGEEEGEEEGEGEGEEVEDEPAFPERGALVTIHDGGPAARVGRIVAPADDEHYEVTLGASNETVHISQLSELCTTGTKLAHTKLVVWTASSPDAARLEMLRESHTPCLGLRIDNAGIWQALSLREIKPGEMSHYGTLADLDCPSTEYVKVKMVMLGRDRSIARRVLTGSPGRAVPREARTLRGEHRRTIVDRLCCLVESAHQP